MPDRENVINAFKERISTCSMIGDGFDVTVNWRLADDILALLKEQKEIKEQFIEAFNTIRDAYNAPANREKILLNYLARNACCCEQNSQT